MSLVLDCLLKYRKVFDIGLQNTFVYRWNFLLRSLFGIIPLIGTVFLWQSIFESRGEAIQGYEFGQMVFYFMLVILVDNLIMPTEDDWQIAAEIRDGLMSSLLLKPLNHLAYRFSLFASYRVLYTAVTMVPVVVIFWYFQRFIRLPEDPSTWGLALVSLAMAAWIQFLIAYSMAMLAFWILEISTIVFILYSFEYFLSGQLFPLDLMPGWFQEVVKWLPFTYELYFPVAVFLERVKGPDLWVGLGIQAGWCILMFGLARTLWFFGVRRYGAVGG